MAVEVEDDRNDRAFVAGSVRHGAAAVASATRTGVRTRWWRRLDPVVCLAAVLVLLPTVAAMASALRNPWAPTNDWALLELQVRDVGTGDTPLVGAWSRFGWDHPGPLPFYVLAVFYRLVPAEHGLLFASAAVNFLATAGCAGLALRQPRARALVVLVGLAVLQRGLGIAELSDPWNPTLPMMPFALYALVCVDYAGRGRSWALPVAAGVGSFVVQAHVGFAQPVAAIALVALFMRWHLAKAAGGMHLTSSSPTRRPWRALISTATVLGAAWLPVLVDQAVGSGNLGTIARWALGDEVGPGMGELTEGHLPPRQVAGAAAWLLDPVGLWLGRSEPISVAGYPLVGDASPLRLVWLLLAGAAVLALARRQQGTDRPLLLGAVAVAAAGVAAVFGDLVAARGAPVFWAFRWAAVVSMLAWVACGWAATAFFERRLRNRDGSSVGRDRRRSLAAAAGWLAVVAVPVSATIWGGTLGGQPLEHASEPLLRLVPAIEEHARRQPVVVASSEYFFNDVDLGLPVVLERAGIAWVEHDDPRAEGHPRFIVMRADQLDGLTDYVIATGGAQVLARSGTPEPGEPSNRELVLLLLVTGPD
jgi:hypothetical protein